MRCVGKFCFGVRDTLYALEAGAVDVLLKPGRSVFLSDMAVDLIMKIKAAAHVRGGSAPGAQGRVNAPGRISGGVTRYPLARAGVSGRRSAQKPEIPPDQCVPPEQCHKGTEGEKRPEGHVLAAAEAPEDTLVTVVQVL